MDIKRALVAVGGGANEFVVRHPASDSSGWTAFAVVRPPFMSAAQAELTARIALPSGIRVLTHIIWISASTRRQEHYGGGRFQPSRGKASAPRSLDGHND